MLSRSWRQRNERPPDNLPNLQRFLAADENANEDKALLQQLLNNEKGDLAELYAYTHQSLLTQEGLYKKSDISGFFDQEKSRIASLALIYSERARFTKHLNAYKRDYIETFSNKTKLLKISQVDIHTLSKYLNEDKIDKHVLEALITIFFNLEATRLWKVGLAMLWLAANLPLSRPDNAWRPHNMLQQQTYAYRPQIGSLLREEERTAALPMPPTPGRLQRYGTRPINNIPQPDVASPLTEEPQAENAQNAAPAEPNNPTQNPPHRDLQIAAPNVEAPLPPGTVIIGGLTLPEDHRVFSVQADGPIRTMDYFHEDIIPDVPFVNSIALALDLFYTFARNRELWTRITSICAQLLQKLYNDSTPIGNKENAIRLFTSLCSSIMADITSDLGAWQQKYRPTLSYLNIESHIKPTLYNYYHQHQDIFTLPYNTDPEDAQAERHDREENLARNAKIIQAVIAPYAWIVALYATLELRHDMLGNFTDSRRHFYMDKKTWQPSWKDGRYVLTEAPPSDFHLEQANKYFTAAAYDKMNDLEAQSLAKTIKRELRKEGIPDFTYYLLYEYRYELACAIWYHMPPSADKMVDFSNKIAGIMGEKYPPTLKKCLEPKVPANNL